MTKSNKIAAVCAAIIFILVAGWLISTLYFSYRVRHYCQQVVDKLQSQSSMIDVYAYDYHRRWFNSTLRFNLIAKSPLVDRLKLSCDGKVIHGPLVMDWVRCWPTAAMVDMDVYYLDAKTESRLAYLGSVRFKVSFDGKIRVMDWQRNNKVLLPNGGLVWRDLEIDVQYLPDKRSLSGVRLGVGYLQVVNRQRTWELTGLDALIITQPNDELLHKVNIGQLREHKSSNDALVEQRWAMSGVGLTCVTKRTFLKDNINTKVEHIWDLGIKTLQWRSWELGGFELSAVDSYLSSSFSAGVEDDGGFDGLSLWGTSNRVVTDVGWLKEGGYSLEVKRLSLNTPLGPVLFRMLFSCGDAPIGIKWLQLLDCRFSGELVFSRDMAEHFLTYYPRLKETVLGQQLATQLSAMKVGNEVRLWWSRKNGILDYHIQEIGNEQ